MRWPIRHQILLPFAVMTLCVVTAVSLLSAYQATRRAEQRIDVQVRDLGRTLLASSFPLTDAVLVQMHGLSGAHFVLIDDAGRIVAASQPAIRGLRLTTSPVDDCGSCVSDLLCASATRIISPRPCAWNVAGRSDSPPYCTFFIPSPIGPAAGERPRCPH